MTKNVVRRRRRLALAATATVATVGLAAPPVHAGTSAVVAGSSAAAIDLEGGDASTSLVCGNVADAQAYADSHGLVIQRNNCHPEAIGGGVELHDVEIAIRPEDTHASKDNEALVELAASGGAATAQTTCLSSAARALAGGSVRNHCWSRARGGRIELQDVTFVSHKGGKETRKQLRGMFMRGDGNVRTRCGHQAPTGQDARDDCGADAVGGAVDLRSVDVTRPDGSVSTNVRVLVRGGDAFASVFCFNYVNPGSQARQSNNCSATSRGGTATLRHVTIHVYPQ